MDPLFLSLDEILEMHEQQIDLYGGSHGLRDAAGLKFAIATSQAAFGGEFLHASIPAMGSGLPVSLVPESPVLSMATNASDRTRQSPFC
jgi:death-on-curing protein